MNTQDTIKHIVPVANGAGVIFERVRHIDPEPMSDGTFVVEFINDGEAFLDVVEQHVCDELLELHPEIVLKQLNTAADAHE